MDEYIKRGALMAEFERLSLGENSLVEKFFAHGVYAVIETFPAADVVSIEVLKKWLYENALNNAGSSYGFACVEISRRLDGLRRYAKEVENENIQSSC